MFHRTRIKLAGLDAITTRARFNEGLHEVKGGRHCVRAKPGPRDQINRIQVRLKARVSGLHGASEGARLLAVNLANTLHKR